MFCEAWPDLKFLIFTSGVPKLLYYSHIPTALIALLLGSFVYFRNRSFLSSKILFAISILFSLWVTIDLILWISPDSRLLMFLWSFLGILSSLIYILCFYFVYVFIEKRDVPFNIKLILGLLILPVIAFTHTNYNLNIFDVSSCGAAGLEGKYFTSYYFFIGFIIFIWILLFAFVKYFKSKNDFKKQIIYLTIGVELFLLAFFSTGFLGSLLVWMGKTQDFSVTQYGLFGVVIFMGFLAYLIVRFQAFNIRLIGAQVLVTALVILVGSQFFFVQNNTSKILTGITLGLAAGFGYMLIRSIMMEVKRKEELQMMTEKLAMANDQLRKLDNAKSEFISIASHQLRTPLTAIKGFVSLLLEGSYGKVSNQVEEILNKVYTSNERLIMLVEDMLNLSRIESGRMEYKFEKIDMGKMCQEVYDTFAIRAKDKKLKFELDLPETPLPPAMTDRAKLQEVVSNLVDNALKYTPQGLVKVALSAVENAVRVAVTDTGIGIPQEEMPYLFQKFSRGKDISRLNTGGTGLGLHVGKKMMEALQGRIWMESPGAGQGSTFFVEVPLEVKADQVQ